MESKTASFVGQIRLRRKQRGRKRRMIRLTFVGDIACDRPLLKAAKNENQYDFSDVFHTQKLF